jgi:hypothetical protein
VPRNLDQPSERRFGWSDMFIHPDEDPRADGGFKGERATLAGFLRDQRLTLELKCAGLDAGGMARRSVPPSNLSLLGLVRHMSEVERSWFRRRLAGLDAPPLYGGGDAEWDGPCPTPMWSPRPGAPGVTRSPSPNGSSTRPPTSSSSARGATSSARSWST